jgi:NADH:ubiquinone oxidoreductase subunit C
MCPHPANLKSRLEAAASGAINLIETIDTKGVASLWCELADKGDLLEIAEELKAARARLLTISVFQPTAPEDDDEDDDDDDKSEEEKAPPASLGGVPIDGESYQIAYHFALDGSTLTLQVFLPSDDAMVDSLTPVFRNASWSERDFMENYRITVVGHPDPRRLFLDPSIEPAALERLIPFTTLVNAASTKALWEKITEHNKGEDK